MARQSGSTPFDYGAHFREMLLLHDLTTLPGERAWRAVPPREVEPHRLVLYLGCNVLRTSHMILTATDVLKRLGEDFVAVGGPGYCCGIVHHRNGDEAAAQGLARNSLRYLEWFQPEVVAMWCPFCIHFYDQILQIKTPFRVMHVAEYLVERLPQMPFVREVSARVALHYHCNSPQRIREAAAVKGLLAAVPGLGYVEIGSDPRLGLTCAPFVQQEIGLGAWQGMVEEELRRAASAGADTLATMYHGCQRYLCIYEEQHPLRIEHYLSVFARSLGIEHEDRYKKYRLWHDPARVLADMATCMAANSVSAERAHEVVERTFP